MPASTLTSKGQITIPKSVRERLGLSAGDILEFAVSADGSIRLEVPKRSRDVGGVLRDFAPSSPVSTETMRQAVHERAAKKARSSRTESKQ